VEPGRHAFHHRHNNATTTDRKRVTSLMLRWLFALIKIGVLVLEKTVSYMSEELGFAAEIYALCNFNRSSLQCFDTVGFVAGRSSDPKKYCTSNHQWFFYLFLLFIYLLVTSLTWSNLYRVGQLNKRQMSKKGKSN